MLILTIWNGNYKGIFVGHGLLHSLTKMDIAYKKEDVRRLEIKKTISLRQMDPQAFLKFRETGTCSFEFTEKLFDYDYVNHYQRQIKTIQITIPAIVNGYESIHATLRQDSNKIVLKNELT